MSQLEVEEKWSDYFPAEYSFNLINLKKIKYGYLFQELFWNCKLTNKIKLFYCFNFVEIFFYVCHWIKSTGIHANMHTNRIWMKWYDGWLMGCMKYVSQNVQSFDVTFIIPVFKRKIFSKTSCPFKIQEDIFLNWSSCRQFSKIVQK